MQCIADSVFAVVRWIQEASGRQLLCKIKTMHCNSIAHVVHEFNLQRASLLTRMLRVLKCANCFRVLLTTDVAIDMYVPCVEM